MLPTTKIFLTHHVRQRFHDRGQPSELFMFHREAKMIFLLAWKSVGRCVAITCWPVEGMN